MLSTAYRVQIPNTFTHSRLLKHKAGPSVAPATFPIEGDLAESWSQPNETTYVFKLRKGVRWHPKPPVNGRELTAEDVRYTVERFLTVKGNPTAYMLKSVDRVEAVDRYTVKFVLKEPFSWLLDVLANPMAVAIVARECVEKFGDLKKAEAVVGTGPWMLDSYRPNVGLTFVRHPNYFVPGLPYIDRIEYLVDEDNASRMAAFLAGKYDLGWEFPGSINRTDWVQIKDGLKQKRPNLRTSSRATSRRTSPCGPTCRRSRTCGCGRPSRWRSTGRPSSTRRSKAWGRSTPPCRRASSTGRCPSIRWARARSISVTTRPRPDVSWRPRDIPTASGPASASPRTARRS